MNDDEEELAPCEPKLTELGNGERLARMFGKELRYVHAWKAWLRWEGTHWRRDQVGIEMAKAKLVVYALFEDAARLAKLAASGDERVTGVAGAMAKFAVLSSKAGALRAAATLAQSEIPIAATPDVFDRDPWMLNVANGTIDLRTGELRPHEQEDMITMLAAVEFDPAALCPHWEEFLQRILPDVEVRAFMQRFLGYSLTGDTSEQVVVFLYGGGANGKSTLLGVVQDILADYALQAPPSLLMAQERGGDDLGRRQRATLVNKRLVLCQEIEAGRFLNEAQVKQLTGGDKITAARLYEAEFEFAATHKLVVATNHKPKVRGQDDGIWRRIRLIPFEVTIPEAERDPDLGAKLRTEAAGILAWCVRGCLDWQRDRLGIPPAVRAASADYRTDEDALAEFLETKTERDRRAFVSTKRLYSVYSDWCKANDEQPWAKKTFTSALVERHYKRDTKTVDGKTAACIVGLRLRHAEGDEPCNGTMMDYSTADSTASDDSVPF